MRTSITLAPGPRTLECAQHAETLGFDRVWVYDSPALYWDCWASLTQLALQTKRVGLGVATVIPGVRHVMSTVSAITTIEALAPGRLAIAIGTGFTGRKTLGERPHTFNDIDLYIRALRGLIQGQDVQFAGKALRSLHGSAGVPLPTSPPPILVAANGPKGVATAKAVGDGIMSISEPQQGFSWSAYSVQGTVLEAGEKYSDGSVTDRIAAGIALLYHVAYEFGGDAVDQYPGGRDWRLAIETIPPEKRHLAIHEGHAVAPPPREQPYLDPEVAALTFTGTADELRHRAADYERQGVSELIFSPLGPDQHREMEQMAAALGLTPVRIGS